MESPARICAHQNQGLLLPLMCVAPLGVQDLFRCFLGGVIKAMQPDGGNAVRETCGASAPPKTKLGFGECMGIFRCGGLSWQREISKTANIGRCLSRPRLAEEIPA